MKNFRSETFVQFIFSTKPSWFLKVIWVFAFVFLMLIFLWTYNTDLTVFRGYFIFIIVGLTIQAGFIYWNTYKIYHLGRQAFLELDTEDLQIITNLEVLIKGFDLYSKKEFFSFDLNKPIYDFSEVDIIFSQESIILLGKSKQFGTTAFASPVELITSKAKTTIANAKVISCSNNGSRVVIEIEDSYYKKPIKIEFKSNYEEIKVWLKKYYQK